MKTWEVSLTYYFYGTRYPQTYLVQAESQMAAIELAKGRAKSDGFESPAITSATEKQ